MTDDIPPPLAPAPVPQPAPRPRRARPRWVFRAAACALALLVAFVVGEVWVRLAFDVVETRPYFIPGIYRSAAVPRQWALLPNYQGTYYQQTERHPVSTNALAMRDPPLTDARRQAKHRLLFLGDSVTFGRGVDDGQPYPALVEVRLRQALGDVACFNGAVEGYDTVQALDALRELGPQLRPQTVLVGWYRNDASVPSHRVSATVIEGYLVETREDYERWKARYVDHSTSPIEWSALIRWLRIQWKNFKLVSYKLDERAGEYEPIGADWPGMVSSMQALGEIKAWCDQHGARMAVILFPGREETEAEPVVDATHYDVVSEACAKLGVQAVRLLEPWRAHWRETGESLYLPRDRCHPNVLGHEKVAEWVGQALLPHLQVEPTPLH